MSGTNIEIVLITFLSGLGGMWYHWLEVVKRGESDSFYEYLISKNPSGTGKTIVAYITTIGTLYSVGSFDAVSISAFIEATKNGIVYAPMLNAIITSITAGYACDSKLNNGITK